ncbi:hypothetical protein I4U23_000670 [Adineta vaga]|nr:hypothetical protein I4U23_000670 [Adineta vaga]
MANVNVTVQSNQNLKENIIRICACFTGWLVLFIFMGWLSKIVVPQVRTLKPKEQMFWQLAWVRAVCGTLVGWAIYLTFVDECLDRDHALATTDGSWTFICVLLGFFIFEEVTLIYFDIRYKTFSKELHLHHVFAFNGFFFAAWYNAGHFYAAKAFVLEASTIFSCICWCLLKLKLEQTKVWKINQMILIHVFHLRSAYEMWWWYDIYRDWANIKQNLPLPYTINMLLGLLAVSLWLTPYWTYKKTVQYFHPVDFNMEQKKGKKSNEIDKTS